MSSKEWTKAPIKDLCVKVSSGGTPSRKNKSYYQNGVYNWIKTQELRDCNIYDSDEKITEEALQNSSAKLFPINTISMAMYGATVGKLGIFKVESATNQACCNMVVDSQKSDYRFLYYSLIYNREELVGLASGAAQQNLNIGVISNFIIETPPLIEQKAIAATLSCLDDKIELNNRINKTLEEIAQAVFKSWFVDFEPFQDGEFEDSELGRIPKGWRVVELGSLLNFVKGKKPKGLVDIKNSNFQAQYLTIHALNGGNPQFAETDKMILANEYDILMVMDGASSGSVYFGLNGIVASTIAKLEINSDNLREVVYQYLRLYESEIRAHVTGSAIPHTDKGYVNTRKIAVPSDEDLHEITRTFKTIRGLIIENRQQEKKLRDIRDTLLPKLMSGEIRVPIEEVQ